MIIETINDRYELTDRLGVGGMGEVFKADDLLLGRKVALKFVEQRELVNNPGAEDVLGDEARTAGALLGHPNVVSVLDLIQVKSAVRPGPALVMEFVEGVTLADWIHSYRPKLDTVTDTTISMYISMCIIDGVQAAHAKGLLHRDIKPLNVLCSIDGYVKVADFGLARVVDALTRTHTVWNRHTPLYAAPEQWKDEKPTKSTDTYQLCSTLYQLFAGVTAVTPGSLFSMMRWHDKSTPRPLSELNDSVPEDVVDVIMRGLSKKPNERPALWEIYDACATGVLTGTTQVTADLRACSPQNRKDIVALTDFAADTVATEDEFATDYPNVIEAAGESIGMALLGAVPSIKATANMSGG